MVKPPLSSCKALTCELACELSWNHYIIKVLLNNFIRGWCVILGVILSIVFMATNVNSAPLDPASMRYKIKFKSSTFGNATLGRVETKLSQTNDGYAIEILTKAQGMAAIIIGSNYQESCEFQIKDGLAIAKDYQGGRVGKTDYAVTYDRDNRKINFSSGDTLDMPEGYIVDNCMFWFVVALLREDGFTEDAPIYVVDGKSKRIRGYKLRSKEEEQIDTSLGSKRVLKLVLERELRPNRTLTFWLSPEDKYLPLRIEESRKSRTTTFEIESFEPQA